MSLNSLLSKKLIIVSGKGGVGKTTMSAALALAFSKAGKKTLLAEIDSQGQIAQLFGRKIGYEVVSLQANLSAINIIPRKSFEEYVLLQLKFKSLYNAVFENKYVRAFIQGTPGLSELMSVGKIYSMIDDYDTIILDAPATGHGMSLLQVPTVVASAVRVGPLKTHSENIETLLKDKKLTALTAVTLPEEMPVTETIELDQWIQKNMKSSLQHIFLNAYYPPFFSNLKQQAECDQFFKQANPSAGLKKSYQLYQTRAAQHQHYQKMLHHSFQASTVSTIPYLFDHDINLASLEKIQQELSS